LQLQWLHQFQFAGYYIAKEKGFYKEAGLDVELLEMTHDTNVVEKVLKNKATYGTGRSSLLIDRYKGKKIVLLSAIFQDSPSVLLTTDLNIIQPKDLKNKRIMVTNDEIESTAILSMFASQNITNKDLKVQQHSFNLQDLVDKKTDAMACYLSNEPYTLNKNNILFNTLNPKDYGFDFYGDLLFTSQEEVDKYPNRVKEFTKASLKGWEYAFDNIEETAQLIFEKYNTQNKTLEHLIFEGKVLRELAYSGVDRIGILDDKKIESIAKIYAITGLIGFENNLKEFVDPLKINIKSVKIGILSSLGLQAVIEQYQPLIDHLNKNISGYSFELVHLNFNNLEDMIETQTVDFVIANPSTYIKMESKHSLVKLATVQKTFNKQSFTHFGSVMFVRKDSKIKTLTDIVNKKVVAVHPNSCGGYIIPKYELLVNNGLNLDKDTNLSFSTSAYGTVQDILNSKYDVGIIRTGILEELAEKGSLNLDDIYVLNQQSHKNFPFLISSTLYPEWSFMKLKHVSQSLSKHILLSLLSYDQNGISWVTPIDDKEVHNVHKVLKIEPYSNQDFNIYDIWEKYKYNILILLFSMLIIVLLVLKLIFVNKRLHNQNQEIENFNIELEQKVKVRTKELFIANEKLQEMVSKDFLTGVSSRLYFYEQSQSAFEFARRANMPLSILLFDIDKFKTINDTYGHDSGDEVLKKFASKIKENLRQSDIFGRLGGEEFCICINNIDIKGAVALANKLRIVIERTNCDVESRVINITTSIGVAQMNSGDDNIDDIIKRADIALYQAKTKGRNQVVVATT
jgi:diguanylate cyclase (GGDEF)-like protein